MSQRLSFTTDFVNSKYSINSINSSVSNDKIIATTHPLVFCSKLPQHWRSNKSLPSLFQVILCPNQNLPSPIGDGYRIWLSASNQSTNSAVLRNYESKLVNGEARFNDLRFISRSGRGKYFDVFIHIDCNPKIVAIYSNAIKVTVDGPREPRNKHRNLYLSKDSSKIPQFRHSQESGSALFPNEYSEQEDLSNLWNISKLEPEMCKELDEQNNKPNPFMSAPIQLHHHRNNWIASLPLQMPEHLTLLQFFMMASTFRMATSYSELYPMPKENYSKKDVQDFKKAKIWRPF